MTNLLRVENKLVNFPFADKITHMFVGSQETAEALGFPQGGYWYREGNLWELRRSLVEDVSYEYDDTKCSECQNWGAPTGCRTCGTTCMGG
jgi:hypothetical protein